jgi:glycosyltransferase involved in cell wall biosynthesis
MLEAMQEGVPVLASDIPPHQQLLNEQRGVLFKAGDVDSCVHSLDWAINNPQEVALMAQSAQKYVKTYYNWEHITSENLKLYTTLTNSSTSLSTSNNISSRPTEIFGRK